MRFNEELFEQVIRLTQPKLKKMLATCLKKNGYRPVEEKGFLYAEGDLPVLLIAHMDTVHQNPATEICYSRDHNIVMSPQGIGGDDRAGVYMILQIIQEVKCHVLFCEDEEIGGHGAEMFICSGIQPQVDYLVEVDRRGSNDAVFYQCANQDFIDFITSFGFEEAFGSFSDISIIAPELKTAAVNISAGYYNEHALYEHINLAHMKRNITRIIQMVRMETRHFRYIYAPRRSYGDYWGGQLPLWDMFPSDKEMPMLMPLPDDAYVKVNGTMVDNHLMHLIDKHGNVYDYLEEVDAAVISEHAVAYTKEGEIISFKFDQAIPTKILSLEEAIALLDSIQ